MVGRKSLPLAVAEGAFVGVGRGANTGVGIVVDTNVDTNADTAVDTGVDTGGKIRIVRALRALDGALAIKSAASALSVCKKWEGIPGRLRRR